MILAHGASLGAMETENFLISQLCVWISIVSGGGMARATRVMALVVSPFLPHCSVL
jgi:hypothetical protein